MKLLGNEIMELSWTRASQSFNNLTSNFKPFLTRLLSASQNSQKSNKIDEQVREKHRSKNSTAN